MIVLVEDGRLKWDCRVGESKNSGIWSGAIAPGSNTKALDLAASTNFADSGDFQAKYGDI